MIVPSKRRYLYDLNHLCINHLYDIDSGMGGIGYVGEGAYQERNMDI